MPNTAEAVVQFVQNSVIVVNTFHFEKATGYNQSDLEALAAVVDGWVDSNYLNNVSNQVTYVQTAVRGLENENDIEVFDGSSTSVGDVSGAPMSNNVTLAISRLTGLTGRTARGRIYYVGLPVAALQADENFIATASVSAIEDDLDALIALADAIAWTAVVVSRFLNGVKRAVAITNPITGYFATDARVDSRRDRLP